METDKIVKLIDKMYYLTENHKITWSYIDNHTKKRFFKEVPEIMIFASIYKILYFSFDKGYFYLVSSRNQKDNFFMLLSRKDISTNLNYISDSYENEVIKGELKSLYNKIITVNTDDEDFIDSFLEYDF